jgi:hypothetical protein
MPYLPSERDPRLVQSERDTPGRRAAARSTFGDSEEVRRSVAKDALRLGHSVDAGLDPGVAATQPDPEEGRALAEAERIFPVREEEDPIMGLARAFTADDDGAESVGPFHAGALAGEVMLREGEITLPEPEVPSLFDAELYDDESYDEDALLDDLAEEAWDDFDGPAAA